MRATRNALLLTLLLTATAAVRADPGLTVTARNPLDLPRPAATVEVPWDTLVAGLPGLTPQRVRVVADGDPDAERVCQALDADADGTPDRLLFQADFGPRGELRFRVEQLPAERAMPAAASPVHAKFVPSRKDDFAWESDRIAFRVYGPALRAETVSNGIDVWVKRVRYPIIEKWYQPDVDYHHDHGEGADLFTVGNTLGCGGTAIWRDGRLHRGENFASWRILADGPVRTLFELTYEPLELDGLTVRDTKRFSLDAGHNLTRIDSTYDCRPATDELAFAAGLVLRPGVAGEQGQGAPWVALWGPLGPAGNGELGTGVVMHPDAFRGARQADDHLVALGVARPGASVTHWAGAGWTRSGDFASAADWHRHLQEWSQRIVAPLEVTVEAAEQQQTAGPAPQRVREVAAMLDADPGGIAPQAGERRLWQRLARRKPYRVVVESAAKLLDEPLPAQPDELFLDYSRTGERAPWERVSRQRRGRIRPLVLAECLEDQGRFLPGFEELVAALCAEPTWVYPAHDRDLANFRGERIDIDLGSSHLASELALARQMLGDRLAPATRDRIADEVRRRVLDPFRDMVLERRPANWWLTGTNNWNSVCLAGVTIAALTTVEEPAERAFFVAAAEASSRHFLRGFTPDGYCSEGLAYWNYGFGRYAMLTEAIDRATRGGVDLTATEAARVPARFGDRVEIVGGVCPTFSDCPIGTRPDPTIAAWVARRPGLGVAARTQSDGQDPRRGSLGQWVLFNDFAAPGPTPRPAAAAADTVAAAPREWFEDAGVLICRPIDGAPPFGVALKGGHNAEHHNHNDVGSYMVVVGDRAVLSDPGAEVYTRRTFSSRRYDSKVINSFGHPLPVVAGALQRTGREAAARVLAREFTPAGDRIVFDLRAAYEVPTLERLERAFHYRRTAEPEFEVTDTVAFSEPQSFEVALITFGQWTQPAPGRLRIDEDGRAADIEIVAEGLSVEISAAEIDENVRTPTKPTRIALTSREPVRTGRLTLRIRPMSAGAP